jgi:hypothetical protein
VGKGLDHLAFKVHDLDKALEEALSQDTEQSWKWRLTAVDRSA